jgi:hypothetical protein
MGWEDVKVLDCANEVGMDVAEELHDSIFLGQLTKICSFGLMLAHD